VEGARAIVQVSPRAVGPEAHAPRAQALERGEVHFAAFRRASQLRRQRFFRLGPNEHDVQLAVFARRARRETKAGAQALRVHDRGQQVLPGEVAAIDLEVEVNRIVVDELVGQDAERHPRLLVLLRRVLAKT